MSVIPITCPQCMLPVFTENFCTNCGTNLQKYRPVTTTVCPKCKTTRSLSIQQLTVINNGYAKFCGECGFNFEEGMA